jgi:hypothetical protein
MFLAWQVVSGFSPFRFSKPADLSTTMVSVHLWIPARQVVLLGPEDLKINLFENILVDPNLPMILA